MLIELKGGLSVAQATLLFYAAATFLLGLVANAAGGANVLQSIFAPSSFPVATMEASCRPQLQSLASAPRKAAQ